MANSTKQQELKLTGFEYTELFHPEGIKKLDQAFLTLLHEQQPTWHASLVAYRQAPIYMPSVETSELLINCATVLELFLAQLFNIEEAVAASGAKTTANNPISVFKKYFILRRAKKELNKANTFPTFDELTHWLETALLSAALQSDDKELAIALLGSEYLNDVDANKDNIDKLVQWCTQAIITQQDFTKTWVSFRMPERVDYTNLVPTDILPQDKYQRLTSNPSTWRERDGFKLTDERMDARAVQDEVNYCIYCHDHDGDFCSKGFPVKKGDPAQGFKKNPLDTILTGCPLEEKISEMNFLKKDGHTLASLAMVMIDNPMCPATGHRICNDCMKSCIYQKQDPVNIPQIETRVLTDVLDLPWGVEIYDLLTRWNPLRQQQFVMKPYNGLKVMIAGMGPAGFTLAHHLLLEGFAVVGFDGLKIEPLSEKLIKHPIYQFDELKESLDERLMAGFGGVAEYGITVRWDKNFLKLIYLSLMRKPTFQVFGGVRFGGTITIEDAWKMGFDHFVVAVGAGLPKALPIRGSMAPGMRQANDFLMALQLGNAAKSSSLTNLQVRLPAVVIGGGLTGVDTATEIQAYYIAQVEKILYRYEILAKNNSEDVIHQQLDPASREILAEYLRHGKAVRKERELAKQEKRQPNFIKLIHEWGGVTIAYRRRMQESPAYINNHEELKKALEEGIFYLESLEPTAVDLNEHGHCETLICHKRLLNEKNEWVATQEEIRLPARSILVATGTSPNTAYEFEYKGTFNRINLQYQHYEDNNGELSVAHGVEHCKDPLFGAFTSYQKDDHRVSLIGDTHPVFHGNVVKAIASGLRTYPKILQVLASQLNKKADLNEYHHFAKRMREAFTATVTNIQRKTNHIIELTIRAPLAAKHFAAGEFYRLQNFETLAPRIDHTLLQMEPLALKVAECNTAQGTLTFIVNEQSATAKLCATLKINEPVSLMGPTGVHAKIPGEHETVLIVGDQSSIAFLRSVGPAMRGSGNRVLYVGHFNTPQEVYAQDKIEAASDAIIWLSSNDELIPITRQSDLATQSDNVVKALIAYQQGNFGKPTISLEDIDRIYVIGNTELLRQFQAARQDGLKAAFVKNPKVFGSVYGNMQCMLKGVCAQCLQWQIDPETGQRTKAVFACSWQDQPLEIIDINHIDERAAQNHLQDYLSAMWVEHIFKEYGIQKI